MAKSRTTAQNLTRLEESLAGEEIEALNKLSPGLGAKVHKLFSNLGNIQAAAAGHQGTVVIAKQKAKDAKGETPDAMKLQGGTIGEASPATKDDQYVTLGQVRSMLTCESLATILEDCIEDHLEAPRNKPACASLALTNPKTIATGLTSIYGVHAQNEFVVITGDDGADGFVRVYRERADNSFRLIGELTPIAKERIQNTCLQGRFLFCVASALVTSQILTIVDVLGMPETPAVVSSTNIGANGHHVFAQGRWVYVASGGGVTLVDVSTPGLPVVRGSTI